MEDDYSELKTQFSERSDSPQHLKSEETEKTVLNILLLYTGIIIIMNPD